jgi:hypothetical protein
MATFSGRWHFSKLAGKCCIPPNPSDTFGLIVISAQYSASTILVSSSLGNQSASMKSQTLSSVLIASLCAAPIAQAGVDLIATGTISGTYEDLSRKTASPLENGAAGNRFGGIGSGLAYAGGTTFLALPDRGPNAAVYNTAIDNTTSYIPRFQTINMSLAPNPDYDASVIGSMPFVLTPTLRDTTLLSSATPLVYGTGAGLNVGSGVPSLNAVDRTHYFSGRSDNFDPAQLSTNPRNARLDPEGIRVSNDGFSVYISDEYGPYLYRFDRTTGLRTRAYKLPDELAAKNLSPVGDTEISGNTVGRVANKGMEGLAITPDGRTLIGVMQAPLEQDTNKVIRIVTVDVSSGVTRQYAYQLTTGSGVSEILAINDHEFLLDERDGKGLGDGSAAKIKQLFKINIQGAQNIAGKTGDLSAFAVSKTLFLDVVTKLNTAGMPAEQIPAKIEGITFGQDVTISGKKRHTLYVSSDNDFTSTFNGVPNPNQLFVFAFDDADLPGFQAQRVKELKFLECGIDF